MATIVRYTPFAPFSLADRWVRPAYDRRLGLQANLYETAAGYVVELPLPGVRPEDLEISVHQDRLALKGKRELSTPENARTHWQGFRAGNWERTFTLPGEVDAESVEARLEHGVLHLTLPRAAHARPRQIKVQGIAPVAPEAPAIEAEASAPSAN